MQSIGRFNYYEILELRSNAPQHDISTAYERAKNTYTGENPAIYTIFSELEARELMTMIEEAFSVLGNKTLRQIYDQRLLGGKSSASDLSYDAILIASKNHYPGNKQAGEKPSYKRDEKFEKEILSQTEWSGDFLKKVREYKFLSIQKLFEITKINPCYITAVENCDPSLLPAAVFVRGYVTQIAKALGLEDKKVSDSYMKIFKEKAVK